MMPAASILVVTYAGHERNLRRALVGLTHQFYYNYEVIIVDDGSRETPPGDGFDYLRLREFGAAPRSNLAAYQEAYRRSSGDFVILTDADMMVPCTATAALMDARCHDGRIVPIVYGLDVLNLDGIPWHFDLDSYKSLPGFWEWHTPQGVYNSEARSIKHHLLFCGMRRDMWDKSGLFTYRDLDVVPEHYMAAHDRRPTLQVPVNVYHQWHTRGEQMSARVRRIKYAEN